MFISKRKYLEKVLSLTEEIETLTEENASLKKTMEKVGEIHKAQIERLKKESKLGMLLEAMEKKMEDNLAFLSLSDSNISFPDDVAIYVEDYFGGKVLKQEATKVVKIKEDGEVEFGLTKKAPSKGYSYLLIQE